MKLVLITAITAFEKEVKKMLKEAKVTSYSYKNVKGFRDASEEGVESNWFGSEVSEIDSVVFYTNVLEENVSVLIDLANTFNTNQESLSHIHIVVLAVEQYN